MQFHRYDELERRRCNQMKNIAQFLNLRESLSPEMRKEEIPKKTIPSFVQHFPDFDDSTTSTNRDTFMEYDVENEMETSLDNSRRKFENGNYCIIPDDGCDENNKDDNRMDGFVVDDVDESLRRINHWQKYQLNRLYTYLLNEGEEDELREKKVVDNIVLKHSNNRDVTSDHDESIEIKWNRLYEKFDLANELADSDIGSEIASPSSHYSPTLTYITNENMGNQHFPSSTKKHLHNQTHDTILPNNNNNNTKLIDSIVTAIPQNCGIHRMEGSISKLNIDENSFLEKIDQRDPSQFNHIPSEQKTNSFRNLKILHPRLALFS
ncbi:hypothetical protein SNEBB_008646 [Seison nebaliae]|nr:hypothetical protein SNEBB_008646 [Seison nebaliae]